MTAILKQALPRHKSHLVNADTIKKQLDELLPLAAKYKISVGDLISLYHAEVINRYINTYLDNSENFDEIFTEITRQLAKIQENLGCISDSISETNE